ncbi:hypothetical protein [Endozoicomonas euniceicola]|uniref:Uncharacterized protein n=1 Tax=Endozoicomonas euniceicola TaxID=1234143 RepID=A0ABY6GP97_9GAMM|nr:hypothetical protein [Endozoicomonas euniceicola]UYM14573.1 hypothetical protein NX720_16965 [Endozoicomonas euniceicola]
MLTKQFLYPAYCLILLMIFANNIYAINTTDSNNQGQPHNNFFKTPSPLNHWPSTCLASQLQIKDKYLNEWLPSFENSITTEDKEKISKLYGETLKDVRIRNSYSPEELVHSLDLEIRNTMRDKKHYYLIKKHFFESLYNLSIENTFNDHCLGSFENTLMRCEQTLEDASSYLFDLSDELAEKAINSFASSQSKKIIKEHLPF